MSTYSRIITEATGVTDTRMLAEIEQSMRDDVFHSTLDWQDRGTLINGAQEAHEIVLDLIACGYVTI